MSQEKSYDALIADGVHAVNEGDFTKAVEIAQKAKSVDNTSADAYHLMAIAYQHNQQWDKSIEQCSHAINNSPYDASLYSLRGFAYLSEGKYDEAQADFEEAISLEDFEPAHRNLVILKISQNKSQEAIDYLVERIQKNPEDVENLELMGMLLEKVGDLEKAKSYFKASDELRAARKDA